MAKRTDFRYKRENIFQIIKKVSLLRSRIFLKLVSKPVDATTKIRPSPLLEMRITEISVTFESRLNWIKKPRPSPFRIEALVWVRTKLKNTSIRLLSLLQKSLEKIQRSKHHRPLWFWLHSAFMVADQVEVITNPTGEGNQAVKMDMWWQTWVWDRSCRIELLEDRYHLTSINV